MTRAGAIEIRAAGSAFGVAEVLGVDPSDCAQAGALLREARQIIGAGFVLTDEIREKLGGLSFGGPTCLLDMRAAYQRLGAEVRERIAGLRVVYPYNNEGPSRHGEPRRFWRYMIAGGQPR